MNRLVLIACVLLGACTSGNDVPDGLLPREKFVAVLTEAQLIEARRNHELVIEQISDAPVAKYYEDLFRSQGVTEEQFVFTYAYYADHPDEMKPIWEEVLTELSRREAEGR